MVRSGALSILLAALSTLPAACSSSSSPPRPRRRRRLRPPSGLDTAGMDTAVAPGDDFYAYANGGWLKATPIPPDKSSYGAGSILSDETRQQTVALIQDAAKAGPGASAETRKVADFYASFMDEAGIEAKGLTPLKPALEAIAAIADRRALARAIGGTIRADVDPAERHQLPDRAPVRRVDRAGHAGPRPQHAVPAAGRPRPARSRLLRVAEPEDGGAAQGLRTARRGGARPDGRRRRRRGAPRRSSISRRGWPRSTPRACSRPT